MSACQLIVRVGTFKTNTLVLPSYLFQTVKVLELTEEGEVEANPFETWMRVYHGTVVDITRASKMIVKNVPKSRVRVICF